MTKAVIKGTGIGADFTYEQLSDLLTSTGREVRLFRTMSTEEYQSITDNNNTFIPYDFAMEMKWFAKREEDCKEWARRLEMLGEGESRVFVAITVLKKALSFMFYSEKLDGVGAAYSADVDLLNKIVRRVDLL